MNAFFDIMTNIKQAQCGRSHGVPNGGKLSVNSFDAWSQQRQPQRRPVARRPCGIKMLEEMRERYENGDFEGVELFDELVDEAQVSEQARHSERLCAEPS